MSKFTYAERQLVKDIVATLSIKRIRESDILEEVYKQTNKTISPAYLYAIKASIKKDSYKWYNKLRSSQYEYIHEYKERISEILDLQRHHQNIINDDKQPTAIKQTSLAELHRLSITLSNFYDVATDIGNGSTLSKVSESSKESSSSAEQEQEHTILV